MVVLEALLFAEARRIQMLVGDAWIPWLANCKAMYLRAWRAIF
jgi:hypothetical protein